MGQDDQGACSVCSEPAAWAHLQWSVLFHVCDTHLAIQRQEWEEQDQAYFGEAGFTFVSEFIPIVSGLLCGYRLPGNTPQIPGPVCGAPATHVQLESDRQYFCDAHRPE